MQLKFIVGGLALAVMSLCALPHCAVAQQSGTAKPTNADAQRVVKIITSDKDKSKAYCDLARLGGQIDEAQQKNDTKKNEELTHQAETLAGKLGPEWNELMNGLQDVDENTADGKAIGRTLESLDEMCER
jgi:ABC-type transporter Mla subunit MlaD